MAYPPYYYSSFALDSTLLVAMLSLNMLEHVPGVPGLITTVSVGASKWSKNWQYHPSDYNDNDQSENLILHVNLLFEWSRDKFSLNRNRSASVWRCTPTVYTAFSSRKGKISILKFHSKQFFLLYVMVSMLWFQNDYCWTYSNNSILIDVATA